MCLMMQTFFRVVLPTYAKVQAVSIDPGILTSALCAHIFHTLYIYIFFLLGILIELKDSLAMQTRAILPKIIWAVSMNSSTNTNEKCFDVAICSL